MADEKGRWFKCYTSLQDSEVWDDLQALRCWLWCMQNVNWKDQKTFGKTFPRGSFWCNVRDAAKACRCSTNSWTSAMRKLVSLGMITMVATPKYTTIKVVNWDRFQGNASESSVSKIETLVETQVETQTETRSRSTRTDRSVENTPAATPPGDSSDRPAKPKTAKTSYDPLAEPIPPSLDTPLFRQAWAAWAAHRSEIKCRLTPQSTKQQIRLLVQLGHDKAVETIRTSIRQSWRGLFPEQPRHNPNERQFKLLNDPIKGVTPDMGVRRKANP